MAISNKPQTVIIRSIMVSPFYVFMKMFALYLYLTQCTAIYATQGVARLNRTCGSALAQP